MLKSIFGKMLGVYFIIIVVSFLVLGTLLYSLLGDYVTSEKEELLIQSADQISQMTQVLLDNRNPVVERLYKLNLETYGSNTHSMIMVIDTEGEIFAASNASFKHLEGQKLNKKQFADLIEGKNIRRVDNFDGMFDQTVLTVGVPIHYKSEVIGGVFLSSPIPEINKVRYDVFRLFIISVSVAVLIAFILIFFLSRKLSKPLKMINRAAKMIASGRLEKRVTILSEDEIGELGRTFNSMAESLQQLEDMRRSFVANVSHELRTPMTTIAGFIEGIMDGTIPEEKQEQYLIIVLDEIRRLSRLVNDLLDLAKMEAGEKKLEMKDFDINELIRLTIIKFETRFTEKNLHVNVLFEDEYTNIRADRDAILRVLTNLIDNAIKFSDTAGNINISVKTANDKVMIAVENNGIGIEEHEIKYVWDRFYKTDKSRSKDKLGTGLGLSIVKNIINQHGQEIWVESKKDEFTRFTFTLEKTTEFYHTN